MNILLTNDDGIYANGIYAIYKELTRFANVTVVAPDSERSSVGHGITLSHPVWYKKINRNKKFFGHGISGTPADCVKFAISVVLKKKPDIIVSGINFGTNDGCSIFYSGTVAGAREGALLGIPSVAVSLATFTNPDFSAAAKYGARIIRKISKHSLPKGAFLNVNVPNAKFSEIKGIKVTRQGLIPIHGTFRKRQDPNFRDYYWLTGMLPATKADRGMDTFVLRKKYVTVTPIQTDTTHYDLLEDLVAWKMEK